MKSCFKNFDPHPPQMGVKVFETAFVEKLFHFFKYAFSSIGFNKTCLCSAASFNCLILPREILWVLPVLLPSLWQFYCFCFGTLTSQWHCRLAGCEMVMYKEQVCEMDSLLREAEFLLVSKHRKYCFCCRKKALLFVWLCEVWQFTLVLWVFFFFLTWGWCHIMWKVDWQQNKHTEKYFFVCCDCVVCVLCVCGVCVCVGGGGGGILSMHAHSMNNCYPKHATLILLLQEKRFMLVLGQHGLIYFFNLFFSFFFLHHLQNMKMSSVMLFFPFKNCTTHFVFLITHKYKNNYWYWFCLWCSTLPFFYRVVEGLPEYQHCSLPINFWLNKNLVLLVDSFKHDKNPGTIGDYIKNNDRAYIIPCCHTDQVQNSFFFKTATDWNHPDNTTVHAASVQRFKALVVATQRQYGSRPPTRSPYSAALSQTTMKQRTFQD